MVLQALNSPQTPHGTLTKLFKGLAKALLNPTPPKTPTQCLFFAGFHCFAMGSRLLR